MNITCGIDHHHRQHMIKLGEAGEELPMKCPGQQIADACQDNIDAGYAHTDKVQEYINSNLSGRMMSESLGYSVYPGGVVAEAVPEDHDDIDRLFSTALRTMLMNPSATDDIEAVATLLGCEVIRVAKQHLEAMTVETLRGEVEA